VGQRPAAERAALRRVQSLFSVRVAEDVPARRKVGLPFQRRPAHIAVGHHTSAPIWSFSAGRRMRCILLGAFVFGSPRKFCLGLSITYLRLRSMSQPGKRLREDHVGGEQELTEEEEQRLLAEPLAFLTELLQNALDGAYRCCHCLTTCA
jgi:hypothetical protein